MILPRDIRPVLAQLEPIVAAWPVRVPFERVTEWMLQFDPEDYDVAARIVRHLNVLGTDEIRSGLSIAYTRLQRKAVDRSAKITNRNTVFAAIGDVGKSGAMMAYEFRVANELPEGNFAEEERENYFRERMVENVVLIDDVLGTGDTAISEAKRLVEETTALGVKNVFVLAICGFAAAVKRIEEEAGAHAFAAFTYGDADTAGTPDGDFYGGLDPSTRAQYMERLKYYNKRCSRSELGYGNVGALLAFRHNTPNVSLPVIWGDGNGWKPLFPRVGRIVGIESYYAQIAAAQRAQKSEAKPAPMARDALELTVLVEGKTDESVMDVLVKRFGLVDLVGVKGITTVSVGGVVQSGRLFDLLKESGRPFVLVLDGDDFALRRRRSVVDEAKVPTVLLNPSFVGLFDLGRLGNLMPVQQESDTAGDSGKRAEHRMYSDIEHRLRTAGLGRSAAQTEMLVETFLDVEKYRAFATDLRRATDELIASEEQPQDA
jgi:hypothetical protein